MYTKDGKSIKRIKGVNSIKYYAANCMMYIYLWLHTFSSGHYKPSDVYKHYVYYCKYYCGNKWRISYKDWQHFTTELGCDVHIRLGYFYNPGVFTEDALALAIETISKSKRVKAGFKND